MNLNKNKSIRKGFFFSKKKFPIMLTVSNGLLIHLLGCNNQVKSGFIFGTKQTNNLDSYTEYGFDSVYNEKTSKQTVIDSLKDVHKTIHKIIYKSDAEKLNSKQPPEQLLEDIEKVIPNLVAMSNKSMYEELFDLITKAYKTLHSRKTQARAINQDDILNESVYKEFHALVIRSIDALYKCTRKKIQKCTNQKSLENENIDSLFKMLNKAARVFTDPKSLKNIDNLHKMLYREVYKCDRKSNINKNNRELSSLLKNIKDAICDITDKVEKKPASAMPYSLQVLPRQLNDYLVNILEFFKGQEDKNVQENKKISAIKIYGCAINKLCTLDTTLYRDIYKCDNESLKNLSSVIEQLTEKLSSSSKNPSHVLGDFVECIRKVLANSTDHRLYTNYQKKLIDVHQVLDDSVAKAPEPNTKENLLKKSKRKFNELIGSVFLLPHKKQKLGPECTKHSPIDSEPYTDARFAKFPFIDADPDTDVRFEEDTP